MQFDTPLFALFYVVFFAAYFWITRTRDQRIWLIVVASLVFYGAFDWRYVPLLVGTGVVDFVIAARITEAPDKASKRRLVTLSVIMNILVLAFFKYANFFLDNAYGLLSLAGLKVSAPTVRVLLPVGVSFYTFQSISYTVDVYRGRFKPRKRFRDFLAALTFFPHLAAGPIVRSSFILPQFEKLPAPTWVACQRGLLLIGVGLAKKTLADLLGGAADPVFDAAGPHSAIDGWTGALAFTGQVYGDFSGYTDMATGLAALMGITLPVNFNLPYVSTSIADFWQRWHISLSTWLRDYVWLPLALSRRRSPVLALVVTMFVGGLWHGARWTFVVWGCYHGTLLALNHLYNVRWPADEARPPGRLVRVGKILGTFYLVVLGEVLFRATTFSSAWSMLRGMHAPVVASVIGPRAVVVLVFTVFGIVATHVLDALIREGGRATRTAFRAWALATCSFAFSFLFAAGVRPFIYFKF